MRNEALRLPHFLDYYRALGVGHFLIVDNGSNDGTSELLADQDDVSLWQTTRSYKASRFGADWLTWLQLRHANRHWALTVDADELLVFPHQESDGLARLTAWMDAHGSAAMSAVMVDMYPKGPLGQVPYSPGTDPISVLNWFDADNFFATPRKSIDADVLRGGVRLRAFFADDPMRAPTMNKIPLVKWNWRYAYLTSTHVILPPRLNRPAPGAPSGALLHTKFLRDAPEKAREEKRRGEHFANSARYSDYYDSVTQGGDLWCDRSVRYEGWQQLEQLGLLSAGDYAG